MKHTKTTTTKQTIKVNKFYQQQKTFIEQPILMVYINIQPTNFNNNDSVKNKFVGLQNI